MSCCSRSSCSALNSADPLWREGTQTGGMELLGSQPEARQKPQSGPETGEFCQNMHRYVDCVGFFLHLPNQRFLTAMKYNKWLLTIPETGEFPSSDAQELPK